MAYRIKKMDGSYEPFSEKKVRQSLERSGATPNMIEYAIQEVYQRKPKSTRKLHELVSKILEQKKAPVAARYNLKRALMDFGPAGYPFEQFVAELFQAQGYATETDQIISGACVDHEVDVVAEKNKKEYMIEAKFHTKPGITSDVKVTLYTQARFEDIRDAREKKWKKEKKTHKALIVTNTRFTSEAHKYAKCKDIELLSWSYPYKNSLAALIDRYGLHPITALTYLSGKQKQMLIKEGLVLCRDVEKYKNIFKKIGFSDEKARKLIKEAQEVCALD